MKCILCIISLIHYVLLYYSYYMCVLCFSINHIWLLINIFFFRISLSSYSFHLLFWFIYFFLCIMSLILLAEVLFHRLLFIFALFLYHLTGDMCVDILYYISYCGDIIVLYISFFKFYRSICIRIFFCLFFSWINFQYIGLLSFLFAFSFCFFFGYYIMFIYLLFFVVNFISFVLSRVLHKDGLLLRRQWQQWTYQCILISLVSCAVFHILFIYFSTLIYISFFFFGSYIFYSSFSFNLIWF